MKNVILTMVLSALVAFLSLPTEVTKEEIQPLSYSKVEAVEPVDMELPFLVCSASAYTEAEDECGRPKSDPAYGITASGEYVRRGIIAVDTDVIPMHSLVRIEGAGNYDGYYEAKDTGGYIVGNRIDIYVPSKDEAWNFGRRNVKVYVVRRGR